MLSDIWDGISGVLGDTLSSVLEDILNATIFKLFYYIEYGLCYIVEILTQLFRVFSGQEQVVYNDKSDYLINIFFYNKAVNNVYWAMALIGIVLIFGFTVWSVIRKMFDASGKVQQSHGQIITSAVRSMVLILGLNIVMSAVITFTNELMKQLDVIFTNAYTLDQPVKREFSEEEFAAMGRILATIGNYSMVPNANNRYNMNLCYNDIRKDLLYLQQQGVFDYSYYETQDGQVILSWQSVLSDIAKSADLTRDAKVDVYNQNIIQSVDAAMKYLQNNKTVTPVESISRTNVLESDIPLDRTIFLMGTLKAAKNSAYNKNPSLDDAIRGPYYFNQGKSIYNFDQVQKDFNIGFDTDYIVVWLAAVAVIFDLIVIILNCVARIFNMLFLYIIAPPVIAAAPLDSGGKFKQWTTAFLVQSLSVFGTVIAMRLLMIYLPIVVSPELVFFEDRPVVNAFAKFALVYGGLEAAKKSTGLLTGILADSAGWQSIQAGDMSSSAGKVMGSATGALRRVGGTALGIAGGAVGFAAKPLTNAIKTPFKNAAEKWSKLGTGESDKSIKKEIEQNKAREQYKKDHPEDAAYLSGGRQEAPKNNNSSQNNPPPPAPPNGQQPNNNNNQNQPPGPGNGPNGQQPNNNNNQNQPPGPGNGPNGQPPDNNNNQNQPPANNNGQPPANNAQPPAGNNNQQGQNGNNGNNNIRPLAPPPLPQHYNRARDDNGAVRPNRNNALRQRYDFGGGANNQNQPGGGGNNNQPANNNNQNQGQGGGGPQNLNANQGNQGNQRNNNQVNNQVPPRRYSYNAPRNNNFNNLNRPQ